MNPEKSGAERGGLVLITTDKAVFIVDVKIVVIKLMTNYLGINLHHDDVLYLEIKTHFYRKIVIRCCHGCSNGYMNYEVSPRRNRSFYQGEAAEGAVPRAFVGGVGSSRPRCRHTSQRSPAA